MSVFVVTYNLNRPGQNYEKLYEILKGFDSWCHPMDSTWFVYNRDNGYQTLKCQQVSDKIKAAMPYG